MIKRISQRQLKQLQQMKLEIEAAEEDVNAVAEIYEHEKERYNNLVSDYRAAYDKAYN